MQKKLSKLAKTLVIILLLISVWSTQVVAASPDTMSPEVVDLDATIYEYTNESGISTYATIFQDASITITYHSSVGMEVVILTYVNGTASVVGVKDIKIQAKSGNSWVTVATSAGGEVTNARGMGCEVTYAGAIEGVTYRVVCTHYANYEGYRELYHESVGMVCDY